MWRRWILPAFIFVFALLSLMTLRSVAPSLLSKQVWFFIIGGVIFFLASRWSFEKWQRFSPALYALLIFLLLMTHVIGRVTRGATSWIPIGSFHVQPSQLATVTVALLFSFWLTKRDITKLSDFLKYGLIVLLPAVLIFLEPELGTTIVYLISLGSIFFLSKTPTRYLVFTMVSFCVVAVVGWNFVLHPYQKERITSFVSVEKDQTGAGYNALQSVIAVGSGQLYGRGLGEGVQSHLRFLPERQTDFVFASFAEEMGLFGALPVILLYASLSIFLILLALQLPKAHQRYFCFATATMLAVQAGINIGMNMGVLPITGITLPLFSYGGSSILAICFQLGCIQALIRQNKPTAALFIR